METILIIVNNAGAPVTPPISTSSLFVLIIHLDKLSHLLYTEIENFRRMQYFAVPERIIDEKLRDEKFENYGETVKY